MPATVCAFSTCDRPATVGVRTTQPRGGLVTTVYWDLDIAPATVSRYCQTCTGELLADLTRTFGGGE